MTDQPERVCDLFVSYATADRAWVEGYLLDALSQAGVRCHSEAAFALGVPRLLEFERAVQQSQRTLLVLSPATLAEGYGQFTDLLAQSYGLETTTWPVIPLVLQPVQLPPRLAMLTALDATDPAQWPAVLERLCAELQRPVPGPAPRPPCPYPGMVPFGEADSDRFFGRDREVQDLLERLRLHLFLTVIGPSGSGKSSLVFAGLVPALRQSGLFGSGEWLVRALRPGEAPLTALQAAVGDVVNLSNLQPPSSNLLLIVDQFEELFILARSEDVEPFQRALLDLAETSHCYVVLTVRADFYPDLMATPLWGEIQAHRAEVLPLDEAGLRQAIVRPAEDVGVFVETALVERLVADAAGEPGVLPLVQETLVLLWERLERHFLPLGAYEALGDVDRTGLQVAMAYRADAALAALTSNQQTIARRVFLRLVQFGEGRADTRRQQPVTTLRAAGDDPTLFDQTLRHLADSRLLTLSGEEQEADRKADIAHEALIAGWPTLQGWLGERREAEQARRRLEVKAAEWVRLGRGSGGLLDAAELAEAEQWLVSPDATDLGLSADLLTLVQTSRTAINPGWHRGGTIGLAAAGLALAALLGLLYLLTGQWPLVLRGTLWLFVGVLVSLTAVAVVLPRRKDPYLGQRFSHLVARRRRLQIGIGLLSVGAVGLWTVVGIQAAQTELHCRACGYEKATGEAIHIAVSKIGTDPYYAKLVSDTLDGYDRVRSWVVEPEDAERCNSFFTYRLELRRFEVTDGQEIIYSATLDPPLPDGKPVPDVSRPREACDMFAELAHKVARHIGLAVIIGETTPPPVDTCRAFMLNEEGYRAYGQKDYQQAELNLRQAVQIQPDYAAAHHNLGLVYLRLERYPEARTAFEKTVMLVPHYEMFLTDLAAACFRLGDYESAERNLLEAIQADPTSLRAHNNLSVVYREWGRYAESETMLQRAMELLGQTSNAEDRHWWESVLYKNQGILAFRRGEWANAITALERADQLHSAFEEEIVYYLAVCYEKTGDTRRACQYWQRYVSVPSGLLFKESERRADAKLRRQALNCGP